MFEFEKICKEIERMDPQTYGQIIKEKSVSIIKALSIIMNDGLDGMAVYMNFILCSIAADGKLAEEEYMLLKPMLEALVGKEVSYDDAVAIFNSAGLNKSKDYKKAVDQMVDVIGMVSLDLKRDIILVCLMICAVDGKITSKERKWVKQLIR
ncbi:MAG: TerB family tellurite resistance protein [Candidatus Methanomethylophilaceae archaeon]|nr:TerB family tellurite resistance protein [Candidatus Methanomethylophilaceae archaeon]